MKTLRVWGYIFIALAVTDANDVMWRKTDPGNRLDQPTHVLLTVKRGSSAQCGAKCSMLPNCFSFNYQASDKSCELFKTDVARTITSSLVADSTWNHYSSATQHDDANFPCPRGSVRVPYDYPNFKPYNPEVEGYVCTDNIWVLEQHSLGNTDCRMVLQYETDYGIGGTSDYAGIKDPYYAAFRKCLSFSCAGLVCDTTLDTCWMKVSTHTTDKSSNAIPNSTPVRHYWYTICQ